MDSVGRAALEGAALGALAGGVGAAVGAAGLSGAAAFAVSEGADFIGGFLYDIGVNGMSREEALINGLAGIGFGGAIGLLGRGISRAARNVNLPLPRQLRRQCASFSAETMVATPDGDKPISEIEVGDVILAYSEATEEVDIYHVSATHTQRHDTTLDITIDGETLHTTDEHPFYVVRDNEEQWVEAKRLHIGDKVVSGLGEIGTVEDIIIIDQPQTMYNLTVALVATYMVGDGQWVVHNCGFTLGDDITLSDNQGRVLYYDSKSGVAIAEFLLEANGSLKMDISTKRPRTDTSGNYLVGSDGRFLYEDKSGDDVSASEVFEAAWGIIGGDVRSIEGVWYSAPGISGNYDRFVLNLRQGMAPEQAALNTWTGKMALRRNPPFNNVLSVNAWKVSNYQLDNIPIPHAELDQLIMASEMHDPKWSFLIRSTFGK